VNQRPTVALLLTSGKQITGIKNSHGAYTQINGTPLFIYVLNSLQNSKVEKIFILGEDKTTFEKQTSPHPKNQYIEQSESPKITPKITQAVNKIKETYGEKKFREINIILVPCDIPYSSPESFNTIIEKCNTEDIITIPIIKTCKIKNNKQYDKIWSIYFKDLNGYYSPQNIITINCSQLDVNENQIIINKIGKNHRKKIYKEMKIIDTAFRTRKKWYNKILIGLLALNYSTEKSKLMKGISLIVKNWIKKMTTQQLINYIEEITSQKIRLEILNETTLSLDIDTKKQLEEAKIKLVTP
jgi:GTP:adenosylcobinamide-phosphate guanylyltransferase